MALAYQALYRVWRPRTFGELVGQEHVARTLQNACRHGRIAHAYLFCGPRGTGKTSTARILAKAVNCLDAAGGEPCNRCANCEAVNNGSSVDVIEIDAASNRGIDEIKSLRERVKFSSSGGRYRVYIIDEVHMLSHDAFNAFLKTLEEPPAHVIFIMATTEAHKVPLTILSRCQRFDFRRIGEGEIRARLAEVAGGAGLRVEPEALDIVAQAAEGGLRDAISILDQAAATGEETVTADHIHGLLGTVAAQTVKTAADHLAGGRTVPLLELVAELEKWGKDPKLFLRDLAAELRRRLLAAVTGKDGAPVSRAWYVLHVLAATEQVLTRATQPYLVLELALIRAGHPEWGFLPEELDGRLAQVEQRLATMGGMAASLPVVTPGRDQTPAAGPKGKEEPKDREPTAPEPTAARRPAKRAAAPPGAAPAMEAVRAPLKKGPAGDHPAEPAPVAATSEGDDVLARVRRAWPAAMEKLRAENQFLYNFVSRAAPVRVDGDRVILGFARGEEFYRDYLERDGGAGLAAVLSGVCPGPWRVGSVVTGEGPPARKTPGPAAEDTGYVLEKLFDARPVGEGSASRPSGAKKGE